MDSTKPGPLRHGDTFLGKYEIRSLLGRGGHAFVYEAYDPFLDRAVAIKVIKGPQDTGRDLGKRARYEAQVLSRIDHKNLVKVLDAGIADGLVYLIMEKLVGRTLRDVLKETHRVSVAEALTLGLQIAEGMDVAHRGQVIHRDLKPENIFIEKGNALKVLDFGIAKVLGIAGHRPETTEKDLLQGTVLYMSPEHLQGFGVTPKSDIYALGTILFEALYSHPLAIGDRPAGLQEAAWMQIARMPPMLDELDPAIPHFVAKLVQRAIVKMPEQRYASMRDLREALSAALTRLREQAASQPSLFVLRDLSATQPAPAGPQPPSRAPRDTVRSAPVLTSQVTVQAPYAHGGHTEPVSKVPFSLPSSAAPTPPVLAAANAPNPNPPRDDRTPLIQGTVRQQPLATLASATAPRPSERPTVIARPNPSSARPAAFANASHLAEQPTHAVAPLVAGLATHPRASQPQPVSSKSVPPGTAPPVSTGITATPARAHRPLLKDRAVRLAASAALLVGVIGGTTYGLIATRSDDQASAAPLDAAPASLSIEPATITPPASPSPAIPPTVAAPPASSATTAASATAVTNPAVTAPEPTATPTPPSAPLRSPSTASRSTPTQRAASPLPPDPLPASGLTEAPTPKPASAKSTTSRSTADADLEQRLKWLDRDAKPSTPSSSKPTTSRPRDPLF